MLGCFLQSYFSGSFRTSWPSLGCIAEDYARAGYIVLPAGKSKDHFVAWQTLLPSLALLAVALGPAIRGESGIVYLAGALVLGASFSATAHALLFKCPPFLHGTCFLLPSSIFRCCLLSSRWTRNEYEGNAQNNAS